MALRLARLVFAAVLAIGVAPTAAAVAAPPSYTTEVLPSMLEVLYGPPRSPTRPPSCYADPGAGAATAINNVGQVVGWSSYYCGDGSEGGFLYDAGQMSLFLPQAAPGNLGWNSYPADINDAGQIVGRASTCGFSNYVAFLGQAGFPNAALNLTWIDRPGYNTACGFELTGAASYINNAGDVFGSESDFTQFPGAVFNFLYSSGVKQRVDGLDAFAKDLDADGNRTVIHGRNKWGQSVSGSKLYSGGDVVDLGISATDINDSGVIVGDNGRNAVILRPTDISPAAITPTVNGRLGSHGWYVGDIAVMWTLTDPESNIAWSRNCGTTTLTADTASTQINCEATNGAAIYNSRTQTLRRDATPPTCAVTASDAKNKTAIVTVRDLTSGIDRISSTKDAKTRLTPEPYAFGTTQVVYVAVTKWKAGEPAGVTVTDLAGNTASC